MALLLARGAVTPGTSVSIWRKLRVGSGNWVKLRESSVVLSSELSLRSSGGASVTLTSTLDGETCSVAFTVVVSARPTHMLWNIAEVNPLAWIFKSYFAGGSNGTEEFPALSERGVRLLCVGKVL